MSSKRKKPIPQLYNHNAAPAVHRNLGISADGRRVLTTINLIDLPCDPQASTDPYTPNQVFHEGVPYSYDDEHIPIDTRNADVIAGVNVKVSGRAKRYQNTDAPIKTFIPLRDEYLDDCLYREGRGKYSSRCRKCQAPSPTVRCYDCHGEELFCQSCCVGHHQSLPLHRVKEWNGTFFQDLSLRDIGLRIQLGHPQGERCQFRQLGHKDFVVIHTNGIHLINLDFCGCTSAPEHRRQLLREGWWPATAIDPQTCSTFAVLNMFHLLSLQGKLSAYDFYRSLEHATENFGLRKLPDRLPGFTLSVREWRHIKMLKRAGRGNDPSGVLGTKPGELAVVCRACPIPGINLPEGWENAPPEIQFLYWLLLCADACFRMKNKIKSSESKDPTLGAGLAFFTDHDPYIGFVKQFVNQDEISTCSGFAAMHLSNLKGIKGHRTSGVGGVCCARQDFWRPNGLGDLQKGERFCNMDYIFMSSIIGISILSLILSYDIACQFIKNFWNRVPVLPARLQPNITASNFRVKIPKFHFDAHGKKGHAQYSFAYTQGVGRTDGEGIERLWAILKGAAPQTIEMGPGARRDTLDDFCGYSNWRKVVNYGNSLIKKMVEAMPEAINHRRAFEEFDANLRSDRLEQVRQWEVEYEAWVKSPTGETCIFDTSDPGVTMAQVRLQLADEEANKSGFSTTAPHTSSTFLTLGLEIEELQRVLYLDVKEKKSPTTLQMAKFQERRVTIRKKIQHFRALQVTYMPGLRAVLKDPGVLGDSPDAVAESIRLYLPSELSSEDRNRVCAVAVCEVEARIRHADTSEALDDLRRCLRTRTYLNKWRIKNISGQHKNTRARALQHGVDVKVHSAKTRYRHSRKALLALNGHGSWEQTLKELKDDDVRALNERALTEHEKQKREQRIAAGHRTADDARESVVVQGALGEGRRQLSWIWFTVSNDENSPGMHEALRVEWAKSKARASRWQEEIMLIEEEMRRVIAFGHWKVNWWRQQADRRSDVEAPLSEGLRAYAVEHAYLELAFAEKVERQWHDVRGHSKSVLADLAGGARSDDPPRTVIDVEIELDDDEL